MESFTTADADWHLVFSPDGTVLDADGAPSQWVGTRFDDPHGDLPDELRLAGRTILERARHRQPPIEMDLLLPSIGRRVHLAVVDALPLRRAPTDLRQLLRSSLDLMDRQAKACDVTLTITVADEVPTVMAIDAEKVAWVTTVLVGNALRYVRRGSRTMPGGSISVTAKYRAATGEVVVEVEDDGPGIPSEQLAVLFERWPQQSRGGLALGLVRDLVGAHGGRVEAVSDVHTFRHGTTIRFTLPVA